MNTLTQTAAAVKPICPLARAVQAARVRYTVAFARYRRSRAVAGPAAEELDAARDALCVLELAAEGSPYHLAPAGEAPAEVAPDGPGPDDAAWWAAECDHADWPFDGELSPEEQEIELATLDRFNDALAAMYADDDWRS